MIVCFEGRSEGGQFVDDAAETPNITLFVVVLLVDLLGWHVVGSAYVGLRVERIAVHDAGQAEIAKFNVVVAVQEDISRFQVSM